MVWSVSTHDERLAGDIDGATFELWGSAEGALLREFAEAVRSVCDVDPNRKPSGNGSSTMHDDDDAIVATVASWAVRSALPRKKLVLAVLSGHGWADRVDSYEIKISPKGRILWGTKAIRPLNGGTP